MNKILLIGFLASSIFVNAKDGFKIIGSDANSITLEYTFGELQKQSLQINNQNFYKISGDNTVPVLEAGFPEVLRSSVSLALPENCEPKLEIISAEFTEIQNFALAPSKGSLKRNINPSDIPYTFGKTYNQNKFYPEIVAQFNSTYMLRGQKGISLSLFPVQANPVTDVIKLYSKVIVKITYETSKGAKLRLQSPSFTSQEEKEILNNRFINLSYLQSASKTAYTPLTEYGSMLVICHPTFTNQIQPLINWKIEKGIKTTLVSSAVTGTTGAQVKTYIQNYYAANPALIYVLIVGDHEQVNAYNAGVAGSETKWSDSYYGLLSGTDHYPEVMVGRFSSSSATDIVTMVNRTLEYEKNPLPGDWYTKVIGIASNEGYGIGDENEADWQHVRKIGNKLLANGYTQHHEFYDSTHLGTDAPGNPNSAMVSSTVNAGASLFIYCGHGSQNACVTSNYNSSNIAVATNNGKYPFSLQVACNNGTFINGTCLSEAFIRAKNVNGPSGAIASVGSSILMAWAEPMDTEDEIGDIISDQYPNLKKYSLGALFYCSQMHMLDMYPTNTGKEVMETWVMFGDPSCMFRSQSPTAITAIHDGCFTAGMTSYGINVPVGPNTFASITQNNSIIGANLITLGNQNVALTSTFNPAQSLLLTITEYNKIPFTSTLTICAIPTGINKMNAGADFYAESVFNDELKLFYTGASEINVQLELYDLQGKILVKKDLQTISTNGSSSINTSQISPGVYLLKVKSNDNTLKVMKVIRSE